MTQVLQFIQSLPSPIAQGFIWGIMAIGVYITYKILDLADLTVDGSFATGGAVLVVLTTKGVNISSAKCYRIKLFCRSCNGYFSHKVRNPCNSCRYSYAACTLLNKPQNNEW